MAVHPEVHGAGPAGSRPLVRTPRLEPNRAPEPPPVPEPDPAAEIAPVAGAELDPQPDPQPDREPTATAASSSLAAPAEGPLPRWLMLLIGAATATVAIAGVREIAWLVGPVLLALVVVVALMPVERWLRRAGAPRWLATTVLLLLVCGILLAFVALLVVSVAQMAALLPDYARPAEALIASVVADLNDAGLVSGQLRDLIAQIDYAQVVGVATGLLASLTDAASTLVLLLVALVFITIEASGFGRRVAAIGAERPHLPVALTLFARGTRSYLLVSTVFGAIVAFGDWVALVIIGIPAAPLWALLAFITNYVPNIGFVLGLLPPALLALLGGGWGDFIAVIVVYSLLNFVVQTLIQPRFVGDSVGLSMTVTFVALLFWGWVLGALGALLAIPLTLLVKALLVDVDPRGHWLDALLREEPRAHRTMRARRRMHARRAALASVRRLHPVRRPAPARVDAVPAEEPLLAEESLPTAGKPPSGPGAPPV
jgi:predicted PurR-regulated permease PerM